MLIPLHNSDKQAQISLERDVDVCIAFGRAERRRANRCARLFYEPAWYVLNLSERPLFNEDVREVRILQYKKDVDSS